MQPSLWHILFSFIDILTIQSSVDFITNDYLVKAEKLFRPTTNIGINDMVVD